MKYIVLMLMLMLFSLPSFAAIDTFKFDTDEKRELFRQLSEELRCPKCQNQNLSDSNSAIAKDLRVELYRMVVDGQNTTQIKDFMVERYGEFVLYRPSVNSLTYALWYGPFVLLIVGFIIVFSLSRNRKSAKKIVTNNAVQNASSSTQTDIHQQRLKELLDKKDD
ncbi:MAG: cytochrome c-type biogenesis protein [Oceanospirillaceae bacterium]